MPKSKPLPPSIKRQTRIAEERDASGQFRKGIKANNQRKITPVGSKGAISRAFIKALHADFLEHGDAVIEEVRKEDPATYFRVVASLVPKELVIDTTGLEGLEVDELKKRFDTLKKEIEDELRSNADGEDRRTREIEATAIDITPPAGAAGRNVRAADLPSTDGTGVV